MKLLKISNKDFMVDDEDYEWLADLKPWRVAGSGLKYACLSPSRKYMGQVIYLHRLIMLAEHGHDVIGMDIDHIDRNPFNCQKSNMRLVTEQENTWNRINKKKDKNAVSYSCYVGVRKNSSTFKGKRYLYNSWSAWIATKYIGSFKTEIEAAKAYDKEAVKIRGSFAQLNFPLKVDKCP